MADGTGAGTNSAPAVRAKYAFSPPCCCLLQVLPEWRLEVQIEDGTEASQAWMGDQVMRRLLGEAAMTCAEAVCAEIQLWSCAVSDKPSGCGSGNCGSTGGCLGCGKCLRALRPCRCSARTWAVPCAAGGNSTHDLQQLTARQGRGAVGPLLQRCTSVMARFVGVLVLRYAQAGAAPTVMEMHEGYSPQDATALQQRAKNTFSESA